MKKRIMIITLILIFLFPLKSYASTTSIEVNVNGKVKKGEKIDILINMKGLESLYAASVKFNYDKNALKIVDLTTSDFIKEHSDEIMEIGGEVDSINNKTSYSFTFLGDNNGINGDETLAVIKAEVLKDGNLSIGEDSIDIKLVKRVGDNVENCEYKFIGYSHEGNIPNTPAKPADSSSESNSSNEASGEDIKSNNSSESSNTSSDNKVINNIEKNNSNIKNNDIIDNYASINDDNQKNLENNKDKSQNKDESKSSSEDTINKEDKRLESDKNNREISNQNPAKLIYISILVLIIIGCGCYYYKSRKAKAKDN